MAKPRRSANTNVPETEGNHANNDKHSSSSDASLQLRAKKSTTHLAITLNAHTKYQQHHTDPPTYHHQPSLHVVDPVNLMKDK